ncbi:hypothetical protein, partial [Bifidobacterium pseudolongum]|uniref:hypothetical protein n=1 Tax=Bifidobacterium pseudolongum TaxID=1694 RepID=UPI0010CFEE0D
THDQITQKPARSGNTADHAEKPLLTLLKNTAHNAERKLLKHKQPSVRAHADIDADSNATRRSARSTAARDSSVRPDTNAFKSSCHMRAHVTHS